MITSHWIVGNAITYWCQWKLPLWEWEVRDENRKFECCQSWAVSNMYNHFLGPLCIDLIFWAYYIICFDFLAGWRWKFTLGPGSCFYWANLQTLILVSLHAFEAWTINFIASSDDRRSSWRFSVSVDGSQCDLMMKHNFNISFSSCIAPHNVLHAIELYSSCMNKYYKYTYDVVMTRNAFIIIGAVWRESNGHRLPLK